MDYLTPTAPKIQHINYLRQFVVPTVASLIEQNYGQHSIAVALNELGIRTSTGNFWKQPNLCRLLDLFGLKTARQKVQFGVSTSKLSDYSIEKCQEVVEKIDELKLDDAQMIYFLDSLKRRELEELLKQQSTETAAPCTAKENT